MLNPHLRFAVETLLKAANPRGEPYYRTTHFQKMVFLLYINLKKKHLDLKLPYCWYHYGPYTNAIEFERQTGVPLSYYTPDDEPTIAIDDVFHEGISSKEAALIDREARKIVKKYQTDGKYNFDYLNNLLDDTYAYAPFEFQRVFNRDFIKILRRLASYDVSKEEVELYLDRLMKYYPYSEIHELYDAYLEWDDTIRLALNFSSSMEVERLAKDFWMIFTEALRMNENENISEDIKVEWRFIFYDKYDKYLADLGKKRAHLLRIYEKDFKTDGEIEMIVDEMNKLAYKMAIER
jgi:hypothetical protein